jgi:hypothetical protein
VPKTGEECMYKIQRALKNLYKLNNLEFYDQINKEFEDLIEKFVQRKKEES